VNSEDSLPRWALACEAAARAGGAVLRAWEGRFRAREKGRSDLVTEADLASQDTILKLLSTEFPDHGFLGEEGAHRDCGPDAPRWIVDPLDGTTNYVHGVPNYSVSVALERAGGVLVGTVYDPCSDECFTATLGGGAYLNGKRLAVSTVERMSQALVATSFSTSVQRGDPEVREFVEVLVTSQAARRMGSSALNLCYVAAGRFDAYWASTTKTWDVAAGFLLVSEAGGVVTGLDGGPVDLVRPRFISAATPALHDELRRILARAHDTQA
jgi:myo-inositol-1(or 4)-monophosphatase